MDAIAGCHQRTAFVSGRPDVFVADVVVVLFVFMIMFYVFSLLFLLL